MIDAICRTNLDNYTCPVVVFAAVPQKGENVDVLHNGNPSTLKVVSVTHKQKMETNPLNNGVTVNVFTRQIPYIEVELNK